MLNLSQKRVEPDITLLEISGRICLGRDCQELEWKVEDLLKQSERKVIFDLAGVNFIDSAGVGFLVSCAAKLTKAGGQLHFANSTGKVAEISKMTMIDRILKFYPSVAEAAEGFN